MCDAASASDLKGSTVKPGKRLKGERADAPRGVVGQGLEPHREKRAASELATKKKKSKKRRKSKEIVTGNGEPRVDEKKAKKIHGGEVRDRSFTKLSSAQLSLFLY